MDPKNISLYLSVIAGLVLAGHLTGDEVIDNLGPEPATELALPTKSLPVAVHSALVAFENIVMETQPEAAERIAGGVRARYNAGKLERRNLLRIMKIPHLDTSPETMALCCLAACIEDRRVWPDDFEAALGHESLDSDGFEEVEPGLEVALNMIERALNLVIESRFQVTALVQHLKAKLAGSDIAYKDLSRLIPEGDILAGPETLEEITLEEVEEVDTVETIGDILGDPDQIRTLRNTE